MCTPVQEADLYRAQSKQGSALLACELIVVIKELMD